MGLSNWLAQWTAAETSAVLGLLVGLWFGVFAQQSRFCLRAACVEIWRGKAGQKVAIWLLAFGAALLLTQMAIEWGWVETAQVRQLNNVGSLSGAIVGGLLFGIGMVLAGGCASRLLVLSATGNLRVLMAGLVVTVVAQAAYKGGLSPLREEIASWWLVSADSRSLMAWLPPYGGVLLGVVALAAALWLGKRHRLNRWWGVAAVLTGLAIPLGWVVTSWHARTAFEAMLPVKSVSLTGPSADTLMALINQPYLTMSFDVGLVPGIFLGSLLATLVAREFKWQTFTAESGSYRFFIGGALMGFGGMLAGGCAVGAGMSGGSLLVITAFATLLSMWLGAGIADWVIDRKADELKAQLAAEEQALQEFIELSQLAKATAIVRK